MIGFSTDFYTEYSAHTHILLAMCKEKTKVLNNLKKKELNLQMTQILEVGDNYFKITLTNMQEKTEDIRDNMNEMVANCS